MRDDRIFEIEYGYWFNQINERLYRHLDVLTNLVQLLGGSAAAMAVIGNWPGAVVASGLALAVCASVGLLVQPSVKCEQHKACKAAWRKLRGKAGGMTDAELDVAVTEIQAEGPTGCVGSDLVALNATMAAIGRTDATKTLNAWQQFLATVS